MVKNGEDRKEKVQLIHSGQTLGIMNDAITVKAASQQPFHPLNAPVSNRYAYKLPGAVKNASSYDFPVQYWPLDISADPSGPRTKTPSPNLADKMIRVGKELERQGVKGISTDCGFYAYFQDEVANALHVPFCSGGLMVVPLVSRLIGSNKRVGIMTWNSRILTKKHLVGAGIDDSIKIAVTGYETYREKRIQEDTHTKEGRSLQNNREILEEDLVDAAQKLVAKHPDIGAIVLECTAFPPAAYAIWKATGLPVFDVVGLLNWLGKSVVRKRPTPI
jgi:hypothetical protein